MEISVIASGSNGNCCLVEKKGTSIMVDAGKSGREIQERMNQLGKCLEDVKAILITHSHSDHIQGAGVLSRRFGIPVYMTKETTNMKYIGQIEKKQFTIGKKFNIGNISVNPIKTSHNVDSCGFVFNQKFGLITDTGTVTKQMEDAMKTLKCVLLESNHDIDMVIKGQYPYFLKNWILGDDGHLSNITASTLIQEHAKNLNLAILGHLSGNNNTPETAMKAFDTIVKRKIDAVIADRNKETGNFKI